MSGEKLDTPLRAGRRGRKPALFSDEQEMSIVDIVNAETKRKNNSGGRGRRRGSSSSRSRSNSPSRSRSRSGDGRRGGSASGRRAKKSPVKRATAAKKATVKKALTPTLGRKTEVKRMVKSATPTARKKKTASQKTAAAKNNKSEINFNIYLRNIAKKKGYSLTADAVNHLNELVNYVGAQLTDLALDQTVKAKRSTILSNDFESVIKIKFSKDMYSRANNEGVKALNSYENNISRRASSKNGDRAANKTEEAKAGLILKVSRVRKIIDANVGENIKKAARSIVYLTAILQSLIETIIEKTIPYTDIGKNPKTKSPRIKQDDIFKAVQNDNELHRATKY